MAYSKIILNGETLIDVTSDTVDAGDLLYGETATKNDGTKVTGSIVSKDSTNLSVDGATVTAAAGYYSSAASKTVSTTTHPNPSASITSSTGVVTATHTQSTGYVTSGTTNGTLNLTTKAAATIYPSTVDQTISSYRWLTGSQTIKSVTTSNLTASNIASGVVVKVGDANNASRISQVTGTYAPTTSSLTVAPTETEQTFNATGVYGYKPVTVNAISSTYIGTGVAKKSSADTTFASTTGTFTAPVGYYSTAATKTITTQAAQTIYPSTADQTIASYRWLTGSQTIKSVTTANLSAENIAEGVVVKVGDATNASRITQVTGTHIGGGNDFIVTLSQNAYGSLTMDKTFSEIISAFSAGKKIAAYGDGSPYYTGSIYVDYEEFDYVEVYGYSISGDDLSTVLCEDDYAFTSTFSEFQSTKYYYEPHAMNATPSDVASGKRFINYSGFQVGTATGSNTITLISPGNTYNGYITYNGVSYFTSGTTFTVPLGDSISIHGGMQEYLYINNEFTEATNPCTYTPSTNVNIGFGLKKVNTVELFESIIPSGTLSITSNGTHNVYGYVDASVNVVDPLREIAVGLTYYSTIYSSGSYRTSGPPNYWSYPYSYTSEDVSNWCDTFSYIDTMVFAGKNFYGSFIFHNARYIGTQAFAIPGYAILGGGGSAYYYFPSCSRIQPAAFGGNRGIIHADFPLCSEIGDSAFYNCHSLTSISFPICSSIAYSAFVSCTNLTSVYFPECSRIGSNAFLSCHNLTSVNFPKCKSIAASVFASCYVLTSVSFPLCEFIGSYAFRYCSSLTEVNFPSCITIDANAFDNLQSLTTISFPVCTTISTSCFYSCYNLSSAIFPECVSVLNYAFRFCSNISFVSFPKCESVGTMAFGNCINLTSVYFPECSYISGSAFWACYSLISVNFPKCSIVSMQAFYHCSELTTVSLPVCESFGTGVFSGCYNLISLYLNQVSSVPTFGNSMFYSTPISTYSASAGRYGSIFVPSSLYTAFKTATSWSAYAARMVSI